jgi:hypothetical protein
MDTRKYKPKKCKGCNIKFTPHNAGTMYCSKCRPEKDRQYRLANREKIRKKVDKWVKENRERNTNNKRNWYLSNRDKILKKRSEHYAQHREAMLERQKKYQKRPEVREHKLKRQHIYYQEYKKRPSVREQRREYLRKYREEHPEKGKMVHHRRRALENGNGGSYTVEELNQLWHEQRGFCYYCGELLYKTLNSVYHIEHKTPLSRGGTNDISNIVLSCAECNLRKGTKTDKEFLIEIGRL